MRRLCNEIGNKVRFAFGIDRKRDEIDDEIAFHIEEATEDRIAQGINPEQARLEALREFGHRDSVREGCQDSWGVRLLSDTYYDIKYGVRQLSKSKGFVAITLLTLSLCIGINTAFFTIMHDMIIRPHDYPDYDRVVNIGMQWRKSQYGTAVLGMSPRRYLDIEEAATSYESMGLVHPDVNIDLHTESGSRKILYSKTTPGIWAVAGVSPSLGRLYTDSDLESGSSRVAVLSDPLWKRVFNSDPRVIGTEIRLNDKTYQVIGVMPPGFRIASYAAEMWVPEVFGKWHKSESRRNNNYYQHLARLKPGVTVEQAQGELQAIYASHLAHREEVEKWPDTIDEIYGVIQSKDRLESIVPTAAIMFWSTQAAAIGILVIGCLNIGGLILTRNYHRKAELAARYTLGAKLPRLFRQLLTETTVLFLVAGIASIPVAKAFLYVLSSYISDGMPIALPTELKVSTLTATFLGTFCCSLIFGSLPAWAILRSDLRSNMQGMSRTASSSRKRHWMQNAFIVGQISVTLLLLCTTIELIKNVKSLQDRSLGYELDDRLFATVSLQSYQYPSLDDIRSFRKTTLERIQAIPGVESSAFANGVPFLLLDETSFQVHGYELGPDEQSPHGNCYVVSRDYLKTAGITLLQGRDFDFSDEAPEAPPSVIVSESVVKSHFQKREPIGSELHWRGRDYTIIGIVNDTIDYPSYRPEAKHTVYLYEPQYNQTGNRDAVFVIESDRNPTALRNAVREEILEINPEISEIKFSTPRENLSFALSAQRFSADFVLLFAAIAMTLSLVGIHGIISHMISDRQREYGIRIALGASSRMIAKSVYNWSSVIASIGICIGILITTGSIRLLERFMPTLQLNVTGTILSTSLLILATTLIATYFPVKKAIRRGPINSLRAE